MVGLFVQKAERKPFQLKNSNMRPSPPLVPEDSEDISDGPRFADESEISAHLVDEFGPSPTNICVFSVKEIDKYNK